MQGFHEITHANMLYFELIDFIELQEVIKDNDKINSIL